MAEAFQRLLLSPSSVPAVIEVPAVRAHARLLVITADLAFYAAVLHACGSLSSSPAWDVDWKRGLLQALEISRSGAVPIIVYDRDVPDYDWRDALDYLNAVSHRTRILLASDRVNEDLWCEVLRHKGYDVMAKSSSTDQLKRTLRFAWLSLEER